jgi:hypothetical protein
MKILLVFVIFFSCCFLACDNSQLIRDNAFKQLGRAKKQFLDEQYDEALKTIELMNYSDPSFSIKIDSLKDAISEERISSSYDFMKNNRSDTTYLDFVLGAPRKKVQEHVSGLIREGRMKNEDTYSFRIGLAGYYSNVRLKGYEVDFYIRDYSCKGLINLNYFEDKLSSLEIVLYSCPDEVSVLSNIVDLYTTKYGPARKHDRFYKGVETEFTNIESFWRVSNKAILVGKVGAFETIIYEDLLAKQQKDSLQVELDAMKKEYHDLKSKETMDNI